MTLIPVLAGADTFHVFFFVCQEGRKPKNSYSHMTTSTVHLLNPQLAPHFPRRHPVIDFITTMVRPHLLVNIGYPALSVDTLSKLKITFPLNSLTQIA